MRKMIVLTLVLVLLTLVLNTASAFEPLRWVIIRFNDGSTLICRVTSTSEACTQAYELNTISRIAINGHQVEINPYLGLTEIVPVEIDEAIAPGDWG